MGEPLLGEQGGCTVTRDAVSGTRTACAGAVSHPHRGAVWISTAKQQRKRLTEQLLGRQLSHLAQPAPLSKSCRSRPHIETTWMMHSRIPARGAPPISPFQQLGPEALRRFWGSWAGHLRHCLKLQISGDRAGAWCT